MTTHARSSAHRRQSPSSFTPPSTPALAHDGVIQLQLPVFKDIKPLRLEDFRQGSLTRRRCIAEHLVTVLNERGFFYLERPTALLKRHGLDDRFERYEAVYQRALLEHPHLKDLMDAPTVFQTGYNATWFPESTAVRQAIEAFMAKPALWKQLRRRTLPVAVRELLEVSEQVYTACHIVSGVLLEALELGYGLRTGGLLRLFRKQTEGAVRFVKYHAPCPTRARRVLTTHASEPHADKSFFTFNLGESRPGLVWLDGQTPRLMPNGEGHWLVTSGRYSEGLTQRLERPVKRFAHTVINDGERVVILGFVTPEGELHDIPVEQWPHPALATSHGPARSRPPRTP